ncbi:unnamed protein product [Dracunculus medinensis]|uniref:Rep_fac-A_C domain-containing protein n=1 Tax=Dracunculus medinensis TaxID=318479 RepID=A0A0N4U0K4_DRAME|nr:unnamed protein product [Dracunculus medinensis]
MDKETNLPSLTLYRKYQRKTCNLCLHELLLYTNKGRSHYTSSLCRKFNANELRQMLDNAGAADNRAYTAVTLEEAKDDRNGTVLQEPGYQMAHFKFLESELTKNIHMRSAKLYQLPFFPSYIDEKFNKICELNQINSGTSEQLEPCNQHGDNDSCISCKEIYMLEANCFPRFISSTRCLKEHMSCNSGEIKYGDDIFIKH